ncbi:MAG: GNAT family N-acetyltransferase [Alphaproteobacteria bacterium]
MLIREATQRDQAAVLDVERRAFGQDDEADLTAALLRDPGAAPPLSLLALADGKPAGHILFTRVTVQGATAPFQAVILAPLAVVPQAQGRGIGSALVRAGLERLERAGLACVFVLGDPAYYARFGFVPASRGGFEPPYPIAEQHADAWRVCPLGGADLTPCAGQVTCADALSRPELWRE